MTDFLKTSAAVALASLTLASGAWAQQFKVIELPLKKPAPSFDVASVGLSQDGRAVVNKGSPGFAAEVCRVHSCKPVPRLADAGGHVETFANDVNELGDVVGRTTDHQHYRAYLLRDGVMTNLGTLAPDEKFMSEATAINVHGEVVGFGQVSKDDHDFRAFHWKDGVMTLLPTFGGPFTKARDINDAGAIVGMSEIANDRPRAFIYSQGVMINLGTLGGSRSEAIAVNNLGDVAGVAELSTQKRHAFRFRNGVMEDLGTLPHSDTSEALGINDAGEVVGYSQMKRSHDYQDHAFFFDANGMHDLNTLLRPADRSRYLIRQAHDINNQGDIAVEAVRSDTWEEVAVILKKID
ncbi:hypothetical protein AACH06_07180 [Ideonella sp. DXS29W]|uniref:HAF repeat-containing protein n=1 Tax=Ideonella lacteola TaxID=2984193 RepID=A0ABU9BPM8_9BURK